jgi:hypothetical protein
MRLTLLAAGAAAPAPAADKVDWTPGQTETNKWCQGVRESKGEEGIYQRLLKRDADLSKRCDNDSHSLYGRLTGKGR